jgi:acyl carrier protein
MGLDGVELIMAVDDRFAIAIGDDEASRIRTVGDLELLIHRKLPPAASEVCLSSFAFHRLRTALRRLFGIARSELKPQSSLADLLPREGRRRAWASLAENLNWHLPDLCRNRILEGGLLAGFLSVIPVAIVSTRLGFIPKPIAWVVGLAVLPGQWVAYRVTRPLAVHLPAQCRTVGQATQTVLAMNFGRIAADRQSWSEEELWRSLCDTVVDQLGVDPDSVTREARFIEDLRVD